VARHFGGRGVAARLPQREFAGTRFDMDGNMTAAAGPQWGPACATPSAMPEPTSTTPTYKLYPSPRSPTREIFRHEIFVPHPYALVDPPSYGPQARWSLFAAHRLADGKNGQLVTFELESDAARFRARFVPD
jgi:hypothetical protein